jgi:hypothetical protein
MRREVGMEASKSDCPYGVSKTLTLICFCQVRHLVATTTSGPYPLTGVAAIKIPEARVAVR